jgi:hypothetical protein
MSGARATQASPAAATNALEILAELIEYADGQIRLGEVSNDGDAKARAASWRTTKARWHQLGKRLAAHPEIGPRVIGRLADHLDSIRQSTAA